jgi:hypothetical protein
MTHLSDRTRLIIGCVLFDLTLVGLVATLLLTHEPPWILGLSWGALTLTAADIISTAVVLVRQEGE